jgi:hypothetical protein
MRNLLTYEEVIAQCNAMFTHCAIFNEIWWFPETLQESSDMIDMYCMGGEL